MQTVKVEVTQHRDELGTGQLMARAHVIDPETDKPIKAGSPREIHNWLTSNGYRWLAGAGAVWAKTKGKNQWSIQ